MNLRLPMRRIVRDVFDPRNDLPPLAMGGAWLFAVGSLLPLLWLIVQGGGLRETGYVFHTVVDGGRSVSIPLLTYSGWSGLLLVWAETLAVSGAILLSAFPRIVPTWWQRVGHGVLVAWSGLWALGTWRLGVIDPGFWTLQAIFLAALCACTIYRAWRCWTPRAPHDRTSAPSSQPQRDREDDDGVSVNYFAERSATSSSSKREQALATLSRIRRGVASAARRAVAAIRSSSARA